MRVVGLDIIRKSQASPPHTRHAPPLTHTHTLNTRTHTPNTPTTTHTSTLHTHTAPHLRAAVVHDAEDGVELDAREAELGTAVGERARQVRARRLLIFVFLFFLDVALGFGWVLVGGLFWFWLCVFFGGGRGGVRFWCGVCGKEERRDVLAPHATPKATNIPTAHSTAQHTTQHTTKSQTQKTKKQNNHHYYLQAHAEELEAAQAGRAERLDHVEGVFEAGRQQAQHVGEVERLARARRARVQHALFFFVCVLCV